MASMHFMLIGDRYCLLDWLIDLLCFNMWHCVFQSHQKENNDCDGASPWIYYLNLSASPQVSFEIIYSTIKTVFEHISTSKFIKNTRCAFCFELSHRKRQKHLLRAVPTKYKGFCSRLGLRGKSRSLPGLLESTKKNWGCLTFFRDN